MHMLVTILLEPQQMPIKMNGREQKKKVTRFLRVPPLPIGMDDDTEIGNTAPVTPPLRFPVASSRPEERAQDQNLKARPEGSRQCEQVTLVRSMRSNGRMSLKTS